ncbi:hypothetical protein ADM96_37320 [Burkholderia sp. ST111]|nr:hypothetical protein ADM96_37320 [Burkholderia sp. ST111]
MDYKDIESLLLDGPSDGWATTLSFEEFCMVSGGYSGSPTGVGTAAQWGSWASCVQAGLEVGLSLEAIAAEQPALAASLALSAANDWGECMQNGNVDDSIPGFQNSPDDAAPNTDNNPDPGFSGPSTWGDPEAEAESESDESESESEGEGEGEGG